MKVLIRRRYIAKVFRQCRHALIGALSLALCTIALLGSYSSNDSRIDNLLQSHDQSRLERSIKTAANNEFVILNLPIAGDSEHGTKKALKQRQLFLSLATNLYCGSPSEFLRSLKLNKSSGVYGTRSGQPIVWSYFENPADLKSSQVPGYVTLSMVSAKVNEPLPFAHVLANAQSAQQYIPDLHPKFADFTAKFRERYFAGRILQLYGGFYLSPTSIFYRPFLRHLHQLASSDSCLLIPPKAQPSILGPIRANSFAALQWVRLVHEMLDNELKKSHDSSLLKGNQEIFDAMNKFEALPAFPSLFEFLTSNASRPPATFCQGSHGRYSLYQSPRDLHRIYGSNNRSSPEAILNRTADSTLEFAEQFYACCVWQALASAEDREAIIQLRETDTYWDG